MSDPRGARLLVPVLCFIITTIAVMQTSVVPIVGTIRDQLGVSTTAAGWVLTANLLAAAVTTPLLGRLADLRGKRPVLLTVLAVVLVGSLLCAATDSFALLLLGRVLQGVSFALFPVGIAVLRAELPPQRLIGAMGLFSGTLGVGGAIGMVLTGLMVSGGDYRRVFWLVAAFNVVALLSAFLVVPKRRRAEGGRIDWLGAALLAVGLALVLLALSEGGTWGGRRRPPSRAPPSAWPCSPGGSSSNGTSTSRSCRRGCSPTGRCSWCTAPRSSSAWPCSSASSPPHTSCRPRPPSPDTGSAPPCSRRPRCTCSRARSSVWSPRHWRAGSSTGSTPAGC